MRILGVGLVLLGVYALWGPGFVGLLLGRVGLIGQVIIGILLIAGGIVLLVRARR